jgi:WD40-like Beta Propeller Repeat
MTLPFRRRHHDDETVHDRARALTSAEMVEPLAADAAGWLASHLEDCAECRRDREAYLADRALLRGLRERMPEPPRDLWARTSAALDRESRARGRRSTTPVRRWQGLPVGAAAGALIVAVVIGASSIRPDVPPSATPGGSSVAVVTPEPQATPFGIDAGPVAFVRALADGSWELVTSDIDAVCPRARPSCDELTEDRARRVNLGSRPTGLTFSPTDDNQLVVESRGEGAAPDRIYVLTVPPAEPTPTPTPAGPPTSTPDVTPTPAATPTPDMTPRSTATPGVPVSAPPGSPEPSPTTPDGAVEIASGVIVVGEAAYSADGQWLAFSARPSDGSTGPDLYLWKVGDSSAVPVTSDHQTYFSAWLDGRVLASRIDPPAPATPGVDASAAPSADPTATPVPEPTADVSADPSGSPQPVEHHPSSFLLDPETLTIAEIAQPDVWLPVVDPTGRFVVYWAGTLVEAEDGLDWRLGTGQLVLDGWSPVPAPEHSPGPSDSPAPEPTAASPDPAATAEPALGPGPAGNPVPIVTEATAAFKAKFDPTGTRLAVWVGEQLDAAIGRLHLVVLDPETGTIEADLTPLPGAPALRKFTIDSGRLAWVSPSGQDGQESAVQVLGWLRDEFGEIRTIPARDLLIVR